MKQIDAREAISLLRAMTRVLCAVGVLALVFTTVNVTRFATSRDVPLPVAILLDPMIGTALAGVLYVDARLAAWGIRPPTWSATLRWGAGCTAALMNSWESLWPDGQIGWPRRADPAAVLLHLTPALLLIALTETIAAYRRTVTDLLERIGPADPVEHLTPPTTAATRSAMRPTDPEPADPHALNSPPLEDRSVPARAPADHSATGVDHDSPHTGDSTPDNRPLVPIVVPAGESASDADVWRRAVTLDATTRATTGKPVSVWRLRTDLRIGPRRARQIRDQLLARYPEPPRTAG
ncbi:extensin [Streptomyces tirandamycinicus]|uniref:Extensin n=1 Tax=Streptomyces tirandamycinicus TaxID=2174846 RepID=A0A2S1SYF2_9ACTN|nr:extensin [Streptomyces tirandamycinicus]AWI31411.1 extensin [Streptomyces tirandamycinicus]